MRAASFVALGILAVLAGPVWALDNPAGGACDDAVARGVWELAIDLCSPEMLPANASDAAKAHLLVGRARAYTGTGDQERAAADAAEAKRLDPNSAAAFDAAQARRAGIDTALEQKLQSIEALWDNGEDERALAEVSQVIAANPKSAKAYALRASIYLARQDNERAKPDIDRATSLTKNCQLNLRARAKIAGGAVSGRETYALSCP